MCVLTLWVCIYTDYRTLCNMTPANTDTVTSQLLETCCDVKDQFIWTEITKTILQRALMEPNNSHMYICLCSKLASQNHTLYECDGQDLTFGCVLAGAFEEEALQRIGRSCKDTDEQQANKTKLLADIIRAFLFWYFLCLFTLTYVYLPNLLESSARRTL
jgi:hypothetical protein